MALALAIALPTKFVAGTDGGPTVTGKQAGLLANALIAAVGFACAGVAVGSTRCRTIHAPVAYLVVGRCAGIAWRHKSFTTSPASPYLRIVMICVSTNSLCA